jgi:hypothetical protein
MRSIKGAPALPRKTTIISMLTAVMLLGTLAAPALATPQQDREDLCDEAGGVYDEGTNSSWNTATCTVTHGSSQQHQGSEAGSSLDLDGDHVRGGVRLHESWYW